MPTDNSAGRSDRSGCQPYRFQSSVLRLWQGQGQCTDHIRQVRGRGDNRTDKGQEASQPQPHLGVTGSLIAKRYKLLSSGQMLWYVFRYLVSVHLDHTTHHYTIVLTLSLVVRSSTLPGLFLGAEEFFLLQSSFSCSFLAVSDSSVRVGLQYVKSSFLDGLKKTYSASYLRALSGLDSAGTVFAYRFMSSSYSFWWFSA